LIAIKLMAAIDITYFAELLNTYPLRLFISMTRLRLRSSSLCKSGDAVRAPV